jgi:repressor LexA
VWASCHEKKELPVPNALTERQKEVLLFVRNYISENESSPRLEEIADYLVVTAPTAHEHLRALQAKGYLYFDRTSSTGFYIRLIERAGTAETAIEIPVAGRFNRYGELTDFPSELGHFATLLSGVRPGSLFALQAAEDLPQASILANDIITFDLEKELQPGDICIAPVGDRLFLVLIGARTFDQRIDSWEMRQEYPIPQAQLPEDRMQRLFWEPLAYDDDSHDYFLKITGDAKWSCPTIPTDFVVGTALRLTRTLAF